MNITEMNITVQKRDGSLQQYNDERIYNAILKACNSVNPDKGGMNEVDAVDLTLQAEMVIFNFIDKDSELKLITVEQIQDFVERVLMEYDHQVAKAYITYRHERKEQRHKLSTLDIKIGELQEMNEKIAKENANKDAQVFNTKRDLLAGVVSEDYAKRNILPKYISEAHEKGIIHWHDMDYSPMFGLYNCMLIDFEDMLANGFTIGNADVETPKSIKTAAALISQIVANVSSNIYGGTTANNIDLLLEPYAKKSYNKYYGQHLNRLKNINSLQYNGEEYIKEMAEKYAKEDTKREIYDSMQSLEYEINTLYNSNGQTPFFTVGFGLGTSWYSREIQKSILNVRIGGLGKSKKTAIFPKLIFALKEGINLRPYDPNYDIKQLALRCATMRMYPDILSYDKIVEITGSFKFPMGCRSFLAPWMNESGDMEHNGRNNLGVVTLNLPRIALETSTVQEFKKLLNDRLELCRMSLMYRISTLDKVKARNAPILYMYGAAGVRLNSEDKVSDIFKNGRASVSLGYIGIHETVTKFYGNDWQNNKEAKEFSISIMKTLKNAVDTWKRDTGYGFSLYGTPAESLCMRFAEIDKKDFGEIKDITDKGYYTNSFHMDVRKKVNPFEKIDFEKEYAKYSSGGFIHYVELPNLKNNIGALEAVWDYAYKNIGYFGVNTPIDKCYKCGFEGEFDATSEGFRCPNCGNNNPLESSCIRRICGYLGNVIDREPNSGKIEEMKGRVKHD